MIRSRQASTPSAGHNSGDSVTATSETVAAGQLRAFVERIERIEADIKDLNGDKSEIYKELRGVGFDVKAVRQVVAARKLDDEERSERETMFDLYWAALNGSVHVHTRTRENIEEFPPHDAETGEIIEQNSRVTASGSLSIPGSSQPQGKEDAGGDSVERHATNSNSQPVATDQHADANTAEADRDAGSMPTCALTPRDDLTVGINSNSSATSSRQTDQPGAEPPPSASGAHSSSVAAASTPAASATETAGAEPLAAPAINSDTDIPAFLRKPAQSTEPKPNPDCQKPQTCRWAHSQASCAKCASDAAAARQRGRAA